MDVSIVVSSSSKLQASIELQDFSSISSNLTHQSSTADQGDIPTMSVDPSAGFDASGEASGGVGTSTAAGDRFVAASSGGSSSPAAEAVPTTINSVYGASTLGWA